MRIIQLCVMGLLLSTAVIAQSDEFFGLQLIPQWSPADELQVEVSNWSKLPLVVKLLAAELLLQGHQPCRFSYERRLELGPTETITPTIADSDATQECLEAQSTAAGHPPVPRALRFVLLSECFVLPHTKIFRVEAVLEVNDLPKRIHSCWLVKAEGP